MEIFGPNEFPVNSIFWLIDFKIPLVSHSLLLPKQTFVLMKTSFVFAFRRCLQDVLIKTNIFVMVIRLQDVFKTFPRRLQDVFKTSSRRLQGVFKTSSRPLAKTSSRRFENVFKTSSRRFQDVLSSQSVVGNTISRHLRDVFRTFLTCTAKTIICWRFA